MCQDKNLAKNSVRSPDKKLVPFMNILTRARIRYAARANYKIVGKFVVISITIMIINVLD